MKTFFSILFAVVIVSIFAADPAQPKVGTTPVINATNGYGGILTVRTQVNVGYPAETGILTLSDAGTVTLTLEADVGLIFGPGTTNVLKRVGTSLVYSNGLTGSGPIFKVVDGSGNTAQFAIKSGVAVVEGPSTVDLNAGVSSTVRWDGTTFFDATDNVGSLGDGGHRWKDLFLSGHAVWNGATNTVFDLAGSGSPEGAITAAPGSIYRRFGGGSGTTIYSKESGAGNTGWVALGAGSSGGDTIWTNNAGVIQLIGGTNILFDPDVADGASAVAFSLNSSNVLSDGSAKLLTIGNGSTVVFSHSAAGLFEIDSVNADVFGFDGTNYFDLALNNGRVTFDLNNSITFEPTIADGSTPVKFDTSLVHTSGNLMEVKNNGTNVYQFGAPGLFEIDSPNADVFGFDGTRYFDLALNNGRVTFDLNNSITFEPTIADGSTPVVFNTSLTHTSGNLAEFKNNGTNRFIIGFSGYSQNGFSDEGHILNFVNETRSAISTFGVDTSTINIATGDGNVSMTATLANGDEGFHFQPTTTSAVTPYVLDTDIAHDGGNLFEFKNNTTNKVWVTFDGEVHAKDFVMEASSLRTADTAGHSATIQAHDDDDNVRRTFVTLQNGNTPSLTIAPPSGGSVTLQGILKAADGTSGITTNIVAGLVTFTIKNGIIVGVSL